jgi:hypothetical protein
MRAILSRADPEGNSIGFVHRLPPKIENTPSSKQTSLRMIHAGFVVKIWLPRTAFT